ncbi:MULTISPECIES: RNA-binding S4 domain-containing protein [Pseudoalteromonas]|uniref:RNA-binding S4 domain-containing protein n=1 Tax=Pseudoalteromonas piscicida TaxID=43662 RepID=A0AAD0W2H3_PSEO7|nr:MULTISPECIES: RNA-binding S4 domain-containing protein [Pseudoalteromonas]ASD65850.1 ribosome-associated protein [Pseudoalteromonas piscicida]AXQ96603.1 RNA-binding S4 domain-containing protein [Pseudoalteromonas piscicida]AXR00889.1 RNA-binding S4 domain-containing protein [Pseudoalteromonas piscicida]USE67873.1 ribosome-associated protein [Pseudoalteromonas flavipulchra]WMO15010.1 RNA-binding S4 domain-containing protein [Pseudoalteromonas piscicida]
MQDGFIEIELEEEPIELCNLLKVLDLAETGGHAKLLITEGYVAVNDEICTQKRKKIYSGDILHFDGDEFHLTLAPDATPQPRAVATPRAETAPMPSKKKRQKSGKSYTQVDKNTGRKPISFG